MTSISATLVKELRDKTGSGMMECKKALEDAGGDIEEAVTLLRKRGQAAAEKKSDAPYPSGEALRAEAEEEAPAILLVVADSAATPIRTLTGATGKWTSTTGTWRTRARIGRD